MATRKRSTRARAQSSGRARRSRSFTNRILNVVPSRNTERDWQFEAAVQTNAVRALAAPPPS